MLVGDGGGGTAVRHDVKSQDLWLLLIWVHLTDQSHHEYMS